ncbi:MAG: neutral/alkaline non-lysosomal ceramidase N-terminal domain-containing protein, partial [Verrucomicrobiota bacterium]
GRGRTGSPASARETLTAGRAFGNSRNRWIDLSGRMTENDGMSRHGPLFTALAALCLVVFLIVGSRLLPQPTWKAGLARVDITPQEPIWLSGYASRGRPSQGVLTPLWAKALAMEDDRGKRILLITLDLIGLDRNLSNRIRDAIAQEHGLNRDEILINTSHTHTGPMVGENLLTMVDLEPTEKARIKAYADFLHRSIMEAVSRALTERQPALFGFARGESSFAINRRQNNESKIPELLEKEAELVGPVDHAVPVLRIRNLDSGKLIGLVFGYACHATVLNSFRISGDYPGFAQADLENRYPGVTALFWAGCGADQNPLPRRRIGLAREYGRRLADAVIEVVDRRQFERLRGPIESAYTEIPLPFAEVPEIADLEKQRDSTDNPYVKRTVEHLLNRPDIMNHVRNGYPYPIQTWVFGDQVRWISLGGEVVVDYALAIKEAFAGEASAIWVAGYSHDVMAYIPSVRVLREGGYEGGGSMVYYGLPGPWDESIETRILDTVTDQLP